MKNKIAFFRVWANPPIAKSVANLLQTTFPEYEVFIIDIAKMIRGDLVIAAINSLAVFLMYGFDIVTGKRSFNNCFWRTPFIFRQIKKLAARKTIEEECVFSFQLGSLFDASVKNIPHFMYTDHTHLENLNYANYESDPLYSSRWIKLEKSAYQNATMVFTRSSNITRSLIEQYDVNNEKIACVYMGINAIPSSGEQNNDDYQNKNILFVGGSWERKGGADLVNAFEIVLQAHPDACLTIVGCDPQIDIPNSHVVGKTLLDKVSYYYERASVFCLPTYREPFGAVFIEAFSYKLPVVATNIGAIPDFVLNDENGYTVDPGDVEGLAGALLWLISSPEKCKLFGERGKALVDDRYNWEAVGVAMRENISFIIKI
ncbi:MAG: glycosyltransferase family 4 protein [Anaerolineales bacterium]|nr:glycosyltransferase family 4 protein [Chloroflexota bacterium]MBL6980979.1 glycosyltransferase family 4 protein [Anaerolineales bacterium]